MPERVDDQLQAVRDLEFGKHRAQMVSYSRLTYVETLADELVLESF